MTFLFLACVGGGLESRIETEMPNKKPKLSTNGAHTGDGEGEEYGFGMCVGLLACSIILPFVFTSPRLFNWQNALLLLKVKGTRPFVGHQ